MGDQIFPALVITMGRGEGQEYSRSTSYPPPHLPLPPPSSPQSQRRGEGAASKLTHGPEEGRGGAASQPGHPTRRWGEIVEGEG